MMRARPYCVYMLASRLGGTLYIGVTNDLIERVDKHKRGEADGFTKRYSVNCLVYFEEFGDIRDAIVREKQLKKWNWAWKISALRGAQSQLG